MKGSIYFKDMRNSDALEDLMVKKLSKLDKYFKSEADAKVTMSTIKKTNFKVEVLIPFNGLFLRAEETTDDMHKSIDRVVEKIERQLRRYKTKIEKRHTKESVRFPDFNQAAFAENAEPVQGEEEPRIVRTKSFELKPMTEEEAILQMELLGHDFYVFEDLSGITSVIYKRKDGNYGLIERATI
ncbi:ribosome-associated translation inhibitor RaiA [Clostridiaceae bacterium HFYG-1003]|nr:ribosome-associated translation inhibitor RaiA [Clostridiaceae bacterium HFYG-1003]